MEFARIIEYKQVYVDMIFKLFILYNLYNYFKVIQLKTDVIVNKIIKKFAKLYKRILG